MIFDAALVFGLCAALFYAVADTGARYGVQKAHPFVGSSLSRFISLCVLSAAVLVAGGEFPPLGMHYVWVVAGGICVPGMFSILFMSGIQRIGVSRAAPIKGSAPVFASLLALALLGERPAWYNLAGVCLVAAGVALISSGRTEGRWRRVHALWPVAAAAVAGLGSVFWRAALPSFPDPLPGALVGTMAATAVVIAITALTVPDRIRAGVKGAWKAFLVVGLAGSFGHFFQAAAFQKGEVYRVSSLIQVSPLITVLFAFILLRHAERITWRVPVGAAVTVSGTILVNMRW